MKQHKPLYIVLLALLLLAGCSRQVRPGDIAGKIYRYEKDGVGGPFTIQLEEDGTFTYHEGSLSSYIGVGTWTLEGNTLCITDEGAGKSWKNYFRADEKALTFQAEGSENFLYRTVADGEKFLAEEP